MYRLLLITLLTGISIMNAVFADTIYKEPLFSLEFNIYGTGVEIRLNDIPVLHNDAEGETTSQKPIPESIINGENVLTVKSFPLKANNNQYLDGAYVEAIISVREKDAPVNNNKAIIQLKLNPTNPDNKLLEGTLSDAGDNDAIILNHNKNLTIVKRSTNIESPFPRWAWQDGQLIDDSEKNFSDLLKKYKQVWSALNSKDINVIHSLYDTAATDFAAAYHYKNKSDGHRIMNTGGMINESEWNLGDIEKFLTKRKYIMRIYANGLLAEIVDTKDKKSPVMYLNPTNRIISFQKFGFYKNKNNEWIMIR